MTVKDENLRFSEEDEIDLDIENLLAGFHRYGYTVKIKPISNGRKREFFEELKEAMVKVDALADRIFASPIRGSQKQRLSILHQQLPEPCWGVEPENGISRIPTNHKDMQWERKSGVSSC